jgi:hypothetical protein
MASKTLRKLWAVSSAPNMFRGTLIAEAKVFTLKDNRPRYWTKGDANDLQRGITTDPRRVGQPLPIFCGPAGPDGKPTILPQYQDPKDPNKVTPGRNWNVTVIDTPGLAEHVRASEGAARNDAELIKIIVNCLDKEVREIHCVFFTCSAKYGLNREDVESIASFVRLFDGVADNCAILVTHAERTGQQDQNRIKHEFK